MSLCTTVGCRSSENDLDQPTINPSSVTTDQFNQTDHISKRDTSNDQSLSRYATCAGGDLIIEHKDDQYIATVTATDIVDYFITASEQTVEAIVDYVCMQRDDF